MHLLNAGGFPVNQVSYNVNCIVYGGNNTCTSSYVYEFYLLHVVLSRCAVTWETSLVWLMWLRCRICGIVFWSTNDRWWNFWSRQGSQPTKPPEPVLHGGLTNNISLPATGDEAMKRLLACKGKDPYR